MPVGLLGAPLSHHLPTSLVFLTRTKENRVGPGQDRLRNAAAVFPQ